MTETDIEITKLVAERVMGWEIVQVGYESTPSETERQKQLKDSGWFIEAGLTDVGIYAIDERHFKFREIGYEHSRFLFDPIYDIRHAFEVVDAMFSKGWWMCISKVQMNAGAEGFIASADHCGKPKERDFGYPKASYEAILAGKAISVCSLIALRALATGGDV